jgi:uncharacterized protein YbjT (DUF2867 family)
MNVLVTGADGFVGRHFCHAFGGVGLADGAGTVDPRDAGRVRAAAIQPDAVLHLLQLLGAIRFSGVFLYTGSGDVYGRAEEGACRCERPSPCVRAALTR